MNKVKDFVSGAGFDIPRTAQQFTKEEVVNVINMIASELVELAQTVMSTEEAIATVQNGAFEDLTGFYIDKEHIEEIKKIQNNVLLLELGAHKYKLSQINRQSLSEDSPDYLNILITCGEIVSLNKPIWTQFTPSNDVEDIISDQADAFVDINYYMLDRTLRHGINMDRFFNIVHDANMAKRGPDGKFILSSTNKVLKPDGWTPPDVLSEAKIQIYQDNFI